ncbi:GlsB/YeaQ/YmgE family stress response membrane protein [Cryptosporangium japonicum]|uniref:GlsB/YeaQ/YmgE family stress response membrane protein n=1 Tax=Cryptosporangium japonicum TaxID=80872 RepID=A0ABN0VB28_9ACTN
MTITGIIMALIIGAIVGALGRLVVPGKQNLPIWLTIVVGIIAAFLGTALARAIGIPTATSGIDWRELAVQVLLAAVGVALVAGLYGRSGGRRRPLAR